MLRPQLLHFVREPRLPSRQPGLTCCRIERPVPGCEAEAPVHARIALGIELDRLRPGGLLQRNSRFLKLIPEIAERLSPSRSRAA